MPQAQLLRQYHEYETIQLHRFSHPNGNVCDHDTIKHTLQVFLNNQLIETPRFFILNDNLQLSFDWDNAHLESYKVKWIPSFELKPELLRSHTPVQFDLSVEACIPKWTSNNLQKTYERQNGSGTLVIPLFDPAQSVCKYDLSLEVSS